MCWSTTFEPRDDRFARDEARAPKRENIRMMSIFRELWAFMSVRKKWWLGPILVTMLLLSALIVVTQGSAVAPFIYALF
jgi:hypothetical protein